MTSTCLVCYEDSQVFILPPCNHTGICWKCCLKLVEGSIFSCPFCKDKPQIKSQLLFVSTDEMNTKDFQSIMKSNPFRSNKNTFYYYSNKLVAEYIEQQTSFHCVLCGEIHQTINLLKKHIYSCHKRQFCDVCLDNRRCIIAQQILYTDVQMQFHLKQGDISLTGQVILYHPNCQFCTRRFYDLDVFRMHLKISEHMKCDICDRNCQKLKYIYYKNYDDLERHHKKTHYVCDVGDCVAKKLENVFASEEILEEHKRRCHRKYKGDRNEKVENIIMGFNKTAEEQVIVYDGIGKSIQKQIAVFQREEKVEKQQHDDQFIDIRQFYPGLTKTNLHLRIDDVINRINQLHDQYGPKMRQVNFNDVFLFKPLEMSSLTRAQLQRFLRKVFPPKDAEAISDIFFTKRNEFTSFNDYFQAIERRMRAYSNIAFFLAFPQLIRFMKDQNKNKVPMDTYYGMKLRTLNVKKPFIFHTFDRYSNVLEFLKSQIQLQMICRCDKGSIEMDKYFKFLKDMSVNYYLQNQDDIYYVSKQKITNLYHMIERCKTKDFLKMNWLLKIGFTQQSYQFIIKNFYYRTREECDNHIFEHFTIKELSLIYIYAIICLQALLDGPTFSANKKQPRTHYFTDFLTNIKRPSKISNRLFEQMKLLEGNAIGIEKKYKESSKKGVIVDENDCPSLLSLKTDIPPQRRKPPQTLQVGIGKSRLPIWNEDQSLRKKPEVKMKAIKNDDEFPTLSGRLNPNEKNEKQEKQKRKKQQQQEFPVFNFNEKFVSPKLIVKGQQKKQINDFVSFNNKTRTNNKWDEEKTRQKFYQIQQETKQKKLVQQTLMKKKKEMQKDVKPEIKHEINFNQDKAEYKRSTPNSYFDDEEDPQLKWAINQSLRLSEKEEVLIYKKQKIVEEVDSKKKIKNKKLQKNQKIVEPAKQTDLLFEKIEEEAQIAKKPIKKQKFKADSSDSEQQPKVQQTSNKKKQKPAVRTQVYNEPKVFLNFDQFATISELQPKTKGPQSLLNKIMKQGSKPKEPLFQTNEFQSISNQQGPQKQSIVNRIIKQSNHPESQNTKKVKSGKNGKKVMIQSVRLF